jgi:uncharacterized protein YndB with AHSA1/START domain
MARVRSARYIPTDPQRVWALVTDWSAHGRWIPFTEVRIDADSPASSGLGTRFTGRSQLGPIVFDDPMTVTEWRPPLAGRPGKCRLVKAGPWLTGWAEIEVSSAPQGTRVVWTEDVQARWTPRVADPVVAVVGSMLFGRTLRKLADELT